MEVSPSLKSKPAMDIVLSQLHSSSLITCGTFYLLEPFPPLASPGKHHILPGLPNTVIFIIIQ
jgi:hypothetical protein